MRRLLVRTLLRQLLRRLFGGRGGGLFRAVVGVALAAVAALAPDGAVAQSNVDPTNVGRRHGWGENVGWANLRANVTHGVRVAPAGYLTGSAWMENLGWVAFGEGVPADGVNWSNTSAGDVGVNVRASGRLSGFAWSENAGWIAFRPDVAGVTWASIEPVSGRFAGHAWSENLGWVSFSGIAAAWVATVSPDLLPVELSGIVIR